MEALMAIIGIAIAIFSNFFFRDNANHENGKNDMSRQNQTTSNPYPSESQTQMAGDTHYKQEMESAEIPSSIDNEQEAQRRQLAERMNNPVENQAEESGDHAVNQHITEKPRSNLTIDQHKLRQQLRRSLSREGLVNSIIMSEILGQPRVLKPYRSPAEKRKQKMQD